MEKKQTQKRKRRSKKDADYINNKEFLSLVISAQETGVISDKLGMMFQMLAQRYATQYNYANYTYLDEMIAHAVTSCIAAVHKFNAEKSDNPFAYYTTVIYHAFLQILKAEKKQQQIRDKLLVEADMKPSFGYEETNGTSLYNEDETEWSEIEEIDNVKD